MLNTDLNSFIVLRFHTTKSLELSRMLPFTYNNTFIKIMKI